MKGILVTGAPRSGTTWVGKIISFYDLRDIIYIHEPFNSDSRIPGSCVADWEEWFQYVTPENETKWIEPVAQTLAFEFGTDHAAAYLRNCGDEALKERQERRINGYIRKISAAHRGSALPLIKDPIALLSAPWLVMRFDLKPIVMIRHPAAFVSSFYRLGWRFWFSNLVNQSLLVRDYYSELLDEIKAIQGAQIEKDAIREAALLWKMLHLVIDKYRENYPGWRYVRHEDISADPVRGFEQLFNYLGLEYSTHSKRIAEEYCSDKNPIELQDHSAIRRNSRGMIKRWKSTLSEEQVETVRKIVEPISSRFYSDKDWS